MGTRSNVGIINEDGTLDVVYVHWDGYIENGVGDTLRTYYHDKAKVKELIEGGDMSSLASSITSCAYYTKRGETRNVTHHKNTNEYLKSLGSDGDGFGHGFYEIEYIYLFDSKNEQWWVIETDSTRGLNQEIVRLEKLKKAITGTIVLTAMKYRYKYECIDVENDIYEVSEDVNGGFFMCHAKGMDKVETSVLLDCHFKHTIGLEDFPDYQQNIIKKALGF